MTKIRAFLKIEQHASYGHQKNSWNHLEINFRAKKFYFSEKILVKSEFIDFLLNNPSD